MSRVRRRRLRTFVVTQALLGLLLIPRGRPAAAGEIDPAVQAQLDAMREMLERQNEVIRRQSEIIERLERRLDEQDAAMRPVAAPPAGKMPPAATPPVRAEAPVPKVVAEPATPKAVAEPARPVAAEPASPPAKQPFFAPVHGEDPIPPISPDQPSLVAEREKGEDDKKEQGALAGFEAGYDDGFVIRSKDPETADELYELRINARLQFRYALFERVDDTWVDGAGEVQPIQNQNEFEIERGRLTFSGYFLSESLQYFINLDADTDENHRLVAHDFWFNYDFNRYVNLHMGKAFVPGSREWLNGSTKTRFADRSLATTFFRPDRSVGVFSTGEPLDDVYYEVMVANGIATTDLAFGEVDRNFAYSGTVFWDPWSNYGEGYADLEWHEELAALVGSSFTFATIQGRDLEGQPVGEIFTVNLANGSPFAQTGVFAPDVSVDHLDFFLWAVDAAMKWKGFSANGELYYRWIDDLQGNGPIPVQSVYNYGFVFETGYMFIPERFDFNLRTSQILGQFGYGAEYAAGVNYYFFGTQEVKLTSDLTRVVHSPTGNSGPNYREGDNGWMWRVQMQLAF